MIIPPSTQITATRQTVVPACTLRLATCCGARNSIIVTPKFVGFHRCRPPIRRTYFDVIEIIPHRTNGHSSRRLDQDAGADAGDVARWPGAATCRRRTGRPRSSVSIVTQMATNVGEYSSTARR